MVSANTIHKICGRGGEFYASDSPSRSRVRGRAADCEHDVDAVGPEPALVASLLHEWPDDLKELQALEVSLSLAVMVVVRTSAIPRGRS